MLYELLFYCIGVSFMLDTNINRVASLWVLQKLENWSNNLVSMKLLEKRNS